MLERNKAEYQFIVYKNYKMKAVENVCLMLRNREIGNDNYKRRDLRILRTLVTQCDRKFEKVWTKTSSKGFQFESGLLFSENYRTCYSGYTKTGGLQRLCTLPKENGYTKCKLEDALIYRCYHENFHLYDNHLSLIGLLTRDSGESLVLYDLHTGRLKQEIFLSRAVKFKYLSWNKPNELLVVKSTHLADNSRLQRDAGISVNVAMVMTVFSAFPLQFVGSFQIDRRTFGSGITTAMLSHDLLIVMYITGHARFYSFKYILDNFRQYSHDINTSIRSSLDSPDQGNFCPGLPMNIKITECPPVLFETRCEGHNVQIGGFPWHFIITPYGSREIFHVFSVQGKKKAKNGCLENHYWNPESDRCCFHDDSSGRIIHVRSPEIRILALSSTPDLNTSEIVQLGSLKLLPDDKETFPQITSSGRCIKRRQSADLVQLDQPLSIHHVDYEDDLDLLYVVATYHSPRPRRVVRFYDNRSFKLLREIELPQQFEEVYEYSVQVDLDTLVEMVKPRLGLFVCNVYRLSGDQSITQVNKSSNGTQPNTGSRSRSSRRQPQSRNSRRVTRTRTR